jgi:hypothetical protein
MPNADNSPPTKYKLAQFHPLFSTLAQSDHPFILIGGQAVNYRGERYLAVEPELEKLAPFTSSDIDFLGTREEVVKLGKLIGRLPVYPSWHALTMLAGVVPCQLEDGETNIEVVRSVPRSTAQEVRATSIKAEHAGFRLQVINPIALLRSKAHLARRVAQSDRQDVNHLHIMVICVRAFLREVLAAVEKGALPPRDWLNIVKDLLSFTESDLGTKVARLHGLDWSVILPELQTASVFSASIRTFYEKRVPAWQARVRKAQAPGAA